MGPELQTIPLQWVPNSLHICCSEEQHLHLIQMLPVLDPTVACLSSETHNEHIERL
jgi:hypothetical protein